MKGDYKDINENAYRVSRSDWTGYYAVIVRANAAYCILSRYYKRKGDATKALKRFAKAHNLMEVRDE